MRSQTLALMVQFSLLAFHGISCADELKGTWEAVAGEEKGTTLTKEDLKKEPVILRIGRDGRMAMRWDKESYDFTLRLQPKADPPAMDLIYPKKKGIDYAIYSIEKDRLTLCFSRKMNPNTEAERPIAFTTDRRKNKDLDGLVMFVFEKKE